MSYVTERIAELKSLDERYARQKAEAQAAERKRLFGLAVDHMRTILSDALIRDLGLMEHAEMFPNGAAFPFSYGGVHFELEDALDGLTRMLLTRRKGGAATLISNEEDFLRFLMRQESRERAEKSAKAKVS